MKKATCGQCVHARPHPNGDIRMRSCHGGPPQILQIITPQGAKVSQFWPQVMMTDETCGMFEPKGPEVILPEQPRHGSKPQATGHEHGQKS